MKSRKNLGLFMVFLLLLITIPLTVWSVKNLRFETRQKASEPTPAEEKEFSEIRPLNINEPIFTFSVSGHISLNKETSLLRVILVDKNQKEYLVYEAYPLIVDQSSFSFTNACEETCILDGILPDYLRIEGSDSIYQIDIDADKTVLGVTSEQYEFKKKKESEKIKKLNEQIKKKGLKWIAGETSVSGLSYEQKKKLFSNPDGTPVDKLPNLQGFEYYKGGIFEIKDENENNSPVLGDTDSNLPDSWDWRNVHGENWNTPIKDQGAAGTCWAFASIGALESLINLYFNQHLNIDLSEQMLVDCRYNRNLPLGMYSCDYSACCTPNQTELCYPGDVYCTIGIHGISDENCNPYLARDSTSYCTLNYICNNWQDRIWKNSDFHDYKFGSQYKTPSCLKQTIDPPEYDFKAALIKYGPMRSAIKLLYHTMVLSGYGGRSDWKTIEHCDQNEEFCFSNQGCIPIWCSNQGEEISSCINSYDDEGNWSTSYINIYKCELYGLEGSKYYWRFKNSSACGISGRSENGGCINNQCVSGANIELKEGQRECSMDYYGSYPIEYQEYSPSNGDNYWIFKNSWGSSWGEEGYTRITTSLGNLQGGSLPKGPIIPPSNHSFWPTGFDGTIKCVDKDNDTYCNWGISENKPDTCPAFCQPQKDCDDSDADLGPFDENLNCTPLNISPTPPPEICPSGNLGNLNCDANGLVNQEDLGIVLDKWAPAGPVPTPNSGQRKADLNNDNKVQETDLTIPLFNWNP